MIKILVVGDPGVGKSTLINQISQNISASPLSEEKNSLDKLRICRAFNARFGLFEVSTLEKLPEDAFAQHKNIGGLLFVYDNACSFADLSDWIKVSKNVLPLTIPRFLVFNKKSFDENINIEETSSTLHSFEVSALDESEVQFLFAKLILEINKNTDEEMAKAKSDNEMTRMYNEILAIKKENKEITEKIDKFISADDIKEFQSQAQKVLEDFRTEGKALIKETQEFLGQLQSFSKNNSILPRLKSATSLPAIEFQETAQFPSVLMNKSKSVHQINGTFAEKENVLPNRQDHDISLKNEIHRIWDTINTIIGNTHDHLEKIRHEINQISNQKQFDGNSKKTFIEKEMPHIISKVKDQVHNYIIGVQKEFEDKIITLEDDFLNTSNRFLQNLEEHRNETERFLKEKAEEIKRTLEEINPVVENPSNLEEMVQSFQSPFLRMRKDEFVVDTCKVKPKQFLQADLETIKEESLPSLWSTLNLVAIRLDRLEHKIIC